MCFVIYLIYVELFDVGAICLWCTSVHIMTFLLFVIIVTATPSLILQLDGPVVNMQGHSRPR